MEPIIAVQRRQRVGNGTNMKTPTQTGSLIRVRSTLKIQIAAIPAARRRQNAAVHVATGRFLNICMTSLVKFAKTTGLSGLVKQIPEQ